MNSENNLNEKISDLNMGLNHKNEESNVHNNKENRNEQEKLETKGLKLKRSTKDRLNILQDKFDDAESMIVALLNQYEFLTIESNSKYADRKSEIDRFNFLLESLKSSFINSLEMASFIQDKYSESLKEEIKKKDKIILMLQKENVALKEKIDETISKSNEKNQELVDVKDSFSRVNLALTTVEKELREKAEIIQNLQLHINSLTDISQESKNFKKENQILKNELNSMQEELNRLKVECEKIPYINSEKEEYKKSLDSLKGEISEYKNYNLELNEKIHNILLEKASEITQINNEHTKYIRMIEDKNINDVNTSNNIINKLKEEIFELKLKLKEK